jgi:two-component system, OmpR family, phosphate regulon sensor histidine kinase PhoR
MPKIRLFWILFISICSISGLSLIVGGAYLQSLNYIPDPKERQLRFNHELNIVKLSILEKMSSDPENWCSSQWDTPDYFRIENLDDCGYWPENNDILDAIPKTSAGNSDWQPFFMNYWYYSENWTINNHTFHLQIVLRERPPISNLYDHNFFWRFYIPAMLVALLCSYLVSRKIAKPIETLEAGALRFASGELKLELSSMPWFELNSLSNSLNRMAKQIDEKIRNLINQSNELKAVLSSMNEGVIATDTFGWVLSMNKAAKDLLQIDNIQRRIRRPLRDAVPNPELVDIIARINEEQIFLMGDLRIETPKPVVLEYRGTPLKNNKGHTIGVLIVLSNVTRLRHLENMRKDFVANVSHELRTPITSIQGFVETLIDGVNEDQQKRFLDIVFRQTQRLTEIIEDLTALSKLEQINETQTLNKKPCKVYDLIENSVETCSILASQKNIHIQIQCENEEIILDLNANLIEQAFINLLTNAIKYSDPDKIVRIQVQETNQQVIINFIDQGFGIPQEHLQRIFERFYRIDKARSRHMGGTGLGLSILNHIVRSHRGNIEVSSKVGLGSRFTIILPIKNEDSPIPS